MRKNKTAEKLADFIEANPDCKFEIDNDGWYMLKKEGKGYNENQIADDTDYSFDTEWYGGSNCYGAGIAEALVILLNRRGFKIEASAV